MAHVASIDPPFRMLKVDWSGPDVAVTACVAELAGQQYAVVAKRGHLDTDIFRAVLARASQASKSDQRITVYTVDPVVLLTLVRERMAVGMRAHHRGGVRPRSSVDGGLNLRGAGQHVVERRDRLENHPVMAS